MQTLTRKKTFVDVILPNYNKAEFLEEAINSVITQTYKNWHLYIIDDHSNDNSAKVIDKFFNLENVTVIKLYKNKGVIVGFGSISSTIGRDVNTVYAASKRGLESLFESLAIMALPSKLKIQYYTIGYLDTNLSYGKKLLLPKGSVNKLAKIVYKNLKKSYKKIYYPSWWVLIFIIIKILPFSFIRYISKFLKAKT